MRDVWGYLCQSKAMLSSKVSAECMTAMAPRAVRDSLPVTLRTFASRDAIHGAKGGPEGELSSGSVLGPVNNLV
jgi:hypothetical protein